MPEAIPYVFLAALAAACWWIGLVRLGVFVPEDVRSWRRLAALRCHALPQTRLERAVRRSAWLQRVQAELDLERLLAVAGREEGPVAFIGRVAALAMFVFATTLLLDGAGRAVFGYWPAPPWLALLLGLILLPLSLLELRHAAQQAHDSCEATLGDMLMQVAVITDTRGLQLHDAIRQLSRCAREPALNTLIDHGGYRRLAPGTARSTVELYRSIAAKYRLDVLAELADAAATTNVGIPERQAFTRLALAVCERRLTDARIRSARAKILVTLPIAAMLIPLLLLIAAPTFQAISSGLGGG